MEAIYILVVLALYLLSIALNKRDSTLIFFSGTLILLSGLSIINSGFGSLDTKLNLPVGIILIFMGLYVAVRVGVEMIEDKQLKVKKKE